MARILLSAAEPSGDVLASELCQALLARGEHDLQGLAGPHMREVGVVPLARTEDVAVMGLVELLGRLGDVRRARARIEEAIDGGGFDVFVGVDAPDLHLPLARRARARGMKAVGFVSPQVWAWRPQRVASIGRAWELLLCLFDFEPALYRGTPVRAVWVGHPVRDRLGDRVEVEPDLFALLPGSRRQEVERLWPVFREVARRIGEKRPGTRFVVVVPSGTDVALAPAMTRAETMEGVRTARGALTKSGTVTLELAVVGVPQVVAHQVHPVTYAIGKRLVTGVRHVAMPNVLAGREVVPEYLQALDPEVLADAVLALPENQPIDLSALGPPGAAGRAADALLEHARG